MGSEYQHGISSYGIPVFGSLPAIKGKYFHVAPYDGKNGNSGLNREEALADIKAAYDKCVDGRGDGIIVYSHPSSTTAQTTSYLTAALSWTKSGITVVGICAPTMFGQRARIANSNSVLTLTHLIDVQGSDNRFYNLLLGNFGSNAAALGGLKVTGGQRNYFFNCQIIGAGHATPAAAANSQSLALSAASENTFERCVIGTDTVNSVGTNASYNMSFASGCQRNVFLDCIFLSQTTSGQAGHSAINFAGAGDAITRGNYFKGCMFYNYNEGAISAQTSLVSGTPPNNGQLLMHDCSSVGYADWDANSAAVVYTSRPSAAADGGSMAAC